MRPTGSRAASRSSGAPSAQAGLLLSLQQSAGNRAVTGLVQRWQDGLARSDSEPRALVSTGAAKLGRATQKADGHAGERPVRVHRRPHTSLGAVQRRTISSGWGKKAVKFKLAAGDLSATVPAGLSVTKSGTGVDIESKPFTATGAVTASGTATEVAKYETGFVQTQFQGRYGYKYKLMGHHRTLGERVLPGILGKNLKVSTGIGLLPIKDGDPYTGDRRDKLFYEKSDVKDFSAASPDRQTTTLDDQPGYTNLPWTETHKGQTVHLVGTEGVWSFRTWLVIRKKSWSSTDYRRLGYIDWSVDLKSTVTPDTVNPQNGQVVGSGNSGGQVTATVRGVGVYIPATGADSANQANARNEKESNW